MSQAVLSLLLAAAAGAEEGAFFARANIPAAAREARDRAASRPRDATALMDAAFLMRDLCEYAEERRLVSTAARSAPEDPYIQAELGWSELRAREQAAAERAFARALALAPGQPRALLGRSLLQLQTRRAQEGLAGLNSIAASTPDFTLAHVLRARALEEQGDAGGALVAYARALKSEPTYSETRLWMAPLYAKARKFDQAWRQYAKVLYVQPAHSGARRESRRLEGLLSQKPDQILSAHALARHLKVVQARRSPRMPAIRVAVGTTQSGKPAPKKAIAFRCDGPFEVVDPDRGRRILLGGAKQVWMLRRVPPRRWRRGSPPYELVDSRQHRLARFSRMLLVRPRDASRHSLVFERLNTADGTAWEAVNDRQLKGSVEVRASGEQGLYLVNILPLEDYLYGVVNEEMPASFPAEALKAQAIIARNHALYSKNSLRPHRKDGYDLCDGQHCQVYSGVSGEDAAGRAACDATRGLVLTWKGEPAQAPYSAHCGGHTQDSGEVSGWASLPYLRGSPDSDGPGPNGPWTFELWLRSRPKAYCNVPERMSAAHYRWSRLVPMDALAERVRRREDVGRLRAVRVLRRSRAGFVNRIEFAGEKGSLVLDRENAIRAVFGLGSIKSTLFVLETQPGPDGMPTELYIYGGGWGHGVGLCQCGAAGRADAGQAAREILAHYYPGARLERLKY